MSLKDDYIRDLLSADPECDPYELQDYCREVGYILTQAEAERYIREARNES